MKHLLNLDTWNRKDHFNFFSAFEEPFFGLTVDVDCTHAYHHAKALNVSFFQFYLYQVLVAVNQLSPFKYRIIDGQVWEYDRVDASAVITRPDGTFGFGYIGFDPDFEVFKENAQMEIAKVKTSTGLKPAGSGENVIHCSALPWLNFKSLSHARNFSFNDSCPKFSFDSYELKMISG